MRPEKLVPQDFTILGHTKMRSHECTPSSRHVPRVISEEDEIRKRGETDRVGSRAKVRFYGKEESKGVEEAERAEILTLLRETLPEHSYTACNEQAEKQ